MDDGTKSGTKRARKKSAKFLSYEQESIDELSKDKSTTKKGKKTEIMQTQQDADVTSTARKPGERVVPKLKIKFKLGAGSKASISTSPKVKKEPDDISPKPKSKKRKAETELTVPVQPSTSSPAAAAPAPAKKKAKKKLTPKHDLQIPVDIEIEAGDYNDNSMASPKFEPEDESQTQAYKKEEKSTSKRSRKTPAKLANDYEVGELAINKAAKFFETKKAESKAATAISKQQKKEKTGKKGKRNRMPTAYTMWCNSYRAKLQAQCPGMDFGAMNKKLGEVWWSIPLKEKNQWKKKAKRLATHGAPKSNTETLKYLGSKALQSLKRNNLPCAGLNGSNAPPVKHPETKKLTQRGVADAPVVFKVTQTEPVDLAAHFEVMSEGLLTIANGLKLNGEKEVHGAMSMLLDCLLCGMSTLLCLTQQVQQLDSVSADDHRQRMANIAYYLPDV